MSLASLIRQSAPLPLRVLIHGDPGVGKSTLAAALAPKALLLPLEKVGAHVESAVAAQGGAILQPVADWPALCAALQTLCALPVEDVRPYRSLVLDGVNHVERWIWDALVASQPADSKGRKPTTVEEVGGGYGKGYTAAVDWWRRLLGLLEAVQAKHDLQLWLVSHSARAKIKNPSGEDYEIEQPALHVSASGLLVGWADTVLFATYERTTYQRDPSAGSKGRGRLAEVGPRVLRTASTGPWAAKSRQSMPPTLCLETPDPDHPEWVSGAPLVALYLRCDALLARLAPRGLAQDQAEVRRAIAAADPPTLQGIYNELRARVPAKEPT